MMEDVTPLNTRGSAKLDQITCNCIDSIVSNETIAALETQEGIKSDHLCVLNSFKFKRYHQFKVKTYQIRKITKKGSDKFVEEFKQIDWQPIYETSDANVKYEYFHSSVTELMDKFFPIKTKVEQGSSSGVHS